MSNDTRAVRALMLCCFAAAGSGCAAEEREPAKKQEPTVTVSSRLYSSDDPSSVSPGTPSNRAATCPGGDLPDQCGTWAGVELAVTRDYWPPALGEKDERCLCEPITFQVPASLPVVEGNAGVGHAYLTFRDADRGYAMCLYRGNARPRVLGGPGGDAYDLVACSHFLKAGASVSADWFSLDVHTGNPLRGPTRVELRLGEPDVVDGVVQVQTFYASDPRISNAALHVPRGSAPAHQRFELSVLGSPAPGTVVENGGAPFITTGLAVDVRAEGAEDFHFAPSAGTACPRIELPYSPSALLAAAGPNAESRLRARQITDLGALASGATALAGVGPASVDPVRQTVSFCTQHLSYYANGVTPDGARLAAALVADATQTGCAGCTGTCVDNRCFTDVLNTAPTLQPNRAYVLRLAFTNLTSTAWNPGSIQLVSATARSGGTVGELAPSPWFSGTALFSQSYSGGSVAQNQDAVFTVNVRAPATELPTSTYPHGSILNLCLRRGIAFFGECFSWDYPPHSTVNAGTTRGQLLEVCDFIDNDGDGQTDEGVRNACNGCATLPNPVGNACPNGQLGACRRQGTYVCNGAEATRCNAPAGTPSAETCNNVDDDCDGATDESLTRVCYTGPAGTSGVGLCRSGSQVCSAGSFAACSGQVLPAAETCDGQDNDCDGSTDEGVLNACGRCGAVPEEVCDGQDNDCDGSTDEGVANVCGGCGTLGQPPGTPCNNGQQGACARSGAFVCTGGNSTACSAGSVTPSPETCNNVDDDCDGATDEDVAPGEPVAKTFTERFGWPVREYVKTFYPDHGYTYASCTMRQLEGGGWGLLYPSDVGHCTATFSNGGIIGTEGGVFDVTLWQQSICERKRDIKLVMSSIDDEAYAWIVQPAATSDTVCRGDIHVNGAYAECNLTDLANRYGITQAEFTLMLVNTGMVAFNDIQGVFTLMIDGSPVEVLRQPRELRPSGWYVRQNVWVDFQTGAFDTYPTP